MTRIERQDAMAARRNPARLSQLWQFPLLLLSLALFGVAAYLFIKPGPRATVDDKIAVARLFLTHDRPEAALEQLNRILETETEMAPQKEAVIHLMLGEALEMGQDQLKLNIPENFRRIIEQTRMGLNLGGADAAPVERRLATSYAALHDTDPAIDHFRRAITMDPDHALDLRRRMIDLLLADEQNDQAFDCLDDYLQQKGLSDAERSWALGQKALLLIDRKQFDDARKLLAEAIKLNSDPIEQGQFNYYLGYCAWREGQPEEAERNLRLARDEMKPSHPLDGEACYVLGRIFQDRNDPKTAESYFEVVLISHPETRSAPLAILGRGICRIMDGDTEAGLEDLHNLTAQILPRPARSAMRADAVIGLRKASGLLFDKNDYQSALEVMACEQQLTPKPQAEFYLRLGQVYENRGGQLDAAAAAASAPADQVQDQQAARDMRTKAGDSYIAYSRALTIIDDKGYGDALWHGIDLYDSAGDLNRVISALELFVDEMPGDKIAPDALLRLGRAYQAAGLFDKAIKAFQQNQFLHPDSLAASKSAVPLAETYIASGPQNYDLAEKTLLGVVENNDLVDPTAVEFRQALFELAQLYYRTQRYELAIARLTEMVQRYPNDADMPQLLFLTADSYRKSAGKLEAQQASATEASAQAAETAQTRRDRLARALDLYNKVLDLYAANPPSDDEQKSCEKLSCFYRADCTYDLGRYADAVKLYEQAAFRYQNDPCALAAYVQIVNGYCALGRPDDARAANERAKWILRQMPEAAFQNGEFSMPKKYWEDWLKWTSQSGLF
jgi:tetratricopeptide (TPR) repeat protein